MNTNITLEDIGLPKLQRILVKRDGHAIGFVEKIKSNGDGTIHPWKAFFGIGQFAKIGGFFYTAADRAQLNGVCKVMIGGKKAAINAVINNDN